MPQSHLSKRWIARSFAFTLEIVFILAGAASLTDAQNSDLISDLNKDFSKYKVVTLNTLGDLRGSSSLQLNTTEKQFELVLQPNDLRAANYHALNTNQFGTIDGEEPTIETFKGKILGEPGSSVRLSVSERVIEGYFVSKLGKFFVEPASRYSKSAGANDFIVYQEKDLRKDFEMRCGTEILRKIERGEKIVSRQMASDLHTLRVLELATEADFEYVNAFGSAVAANNEILSILNMVEGAYESELGLTLSITLQHTWSTPDPYTPTNAVSVLNSFKDYWNANFPTTQYPRDTAHIWTAKANSLSQGYAFIGVVCANPSYAYGLSGKLDWAPAKYDISAHEIAHNLGGSHVDAPQGCADTVMNPVLTVQTPLTFCPYSRSEISGYVNTNISCLSRRVIGGARFDFDGDGKSDLGIFRPASGEWWLQKSFEGAYATQFGSSTDMMAPADFTGDGKTDIAFFRPSMGQWFILRSEDSSFYGFPFGAAGDVSVPADYDGDGKADAAVFRPSFATWFILRSSDNGVTIATFGASTDKPVPADYDGDGKADIAIFRSNGTNKEWWIQKSAGGVFAATFGVAGDISVPGDYTGDGKTDVALFRPSTGQWFVLRSEDNSFFAFPFGAGTDVPAPGDYDGDGKSDATVFRPTTSNWYTLRSSDSVVTTTSFGIATDKPVAGYYVP
jgi:hypothetical protein